LDWPAAIGRTRRGTSAPRPSIVAAVEARLHARDRAGRNRDPTTGSASASVGGRNRAHLRPAPTRGGVWPSLVPRTLSGPGGRGARGGLCTIRGGDPRGQSRRRGRGVPRPRLRVDAHGDAVRPEVLGQYGHERHVRECSPPLGSAQRTRRGGTAGTVRGECDVLQASARGTL